MEELLKLECRRDQEKVRSYVTKLKGKSLQRKAHRVERIVVEEENKHEEETERVSVLIRTEAEEIVERHNDYYSCQYP